MRFRYSHRGVATQVYTSDRKPLLVVPNGFVETTDEKLIERLKADPLFSLESVAVQTTTLAPNLIDLPKPKNKGGRPKKVNHDADAAQATGT